MSVLVERGLAAQMPDGTTLLADVYRPAGPGRWPVLLMRTPYGKAQMPLISASFDPVKAAEAGFAVVVQDVRGRHTSGGSTFVPYWNERQDGADTVHWAAELPFSDGNVGMFGVSYMAGAAWLAAAAAPSPLKAIATAQAPCDLYSSMHPGGALCWATLIDWALGAIGIDALMRAIGPVPELRDQVIRMVDDIDDFATWAEHRPLLTFPPARPDRPDVLGFFRDYITHTTRDDYWRAGLAREQLEGIDVPALIVAGWHDTLLRGDLEHYARQAGDRTQLLIGPWAHGTFGQTVGQVDFGLRASGMSVDLKGDLTSIQVTWFDRWLRDGSAVKAALSPVTIFVQGTNRWREEPTWPPERACPSRFHLTAAQGVTSEPPSDGAGPSGYTYDPDDPCPTMGGGLLAPAVYPRGPVDQTPILSRADVLLFTGQPLAEPLELVGPIGAVIFAATDGPDTDWVVKLCDVHPDGRVLNICDGIMRASARTGVDRREPVVPDEVVRYDIDLGATAIVLPTGHRIAVLVTSSDFPRYDRNPNTDPAIDDARARPAKQLIFHDAERPSHLVLPVVPGVQNEN